MKVRNGNIFLKLLDKWKNKKHNIINDAYLFKLLN